VSERRETTSGIEVRPLYGPADAGDPARIGAPGEFPFTRGLRADGYRARPWTIRQYAGYGSAKEANERFRFLLAQGQPGLSVAFDLPTQMGLDSDDARSLGEVGRVGVAIDSLDDVVALFDGIPLDRVSTSMTINAPAPVLVALYVVAAELQGVPAAAVRGTAQNDVLKEYVARGTYIYPPRPSLRLAADLVAWCATEAPRFNAISLSGYHMREAGSTAVQEMAFAFANAIAYVEAVLAHGIAVDDFAPRLSWIFNTHTSFFEEIAKYRALRRMWATIMRERFGALDPRSLQLRTHTQTGGSTLTLQQPENNIVRAALQALAAVLGGVQSLALSCYDEAIAIPTEHAQTLAVRTQQILAEEIGVTDTADPLGGSWYVESLTDELEARAWELLAEVEKVGGAVAAVETGFYQRAIDEQAYRAEMALESGGRVVVGVNRYREGDDPQPSFFEVDPALAGGQLARLAAVRDGRDGAAVESALAALRGDCERPAVNTMPAIIAAVRARATLGEICGAMRAVFGEYKPV
jgi:methylmalonyl-CoA mutase N-terminal domain/subunit